MPGINSGNFYNGRSGGNNKQMIFLGVGIVVVIIATFMTYRYFTQGVGDNAPVVRTEEAAGVKPLGQEEKGALPKEAQGVQDALTIYNSIADVSFDTEFFNDAKFKTLVEPVIIIPEAFPRPGRVFELWEVPGTGPKPSTPGVGGSPPPPAGSTVRIRR
ncbi:MAG: hypothetical protein AAB417_04305 [Patescibacteria group bacterium]